MMTPVPRAEVALPPPCCCAAWMAASFCSGDSPACTSLTPSRPAQSHAQSHALDLIDVGLWCFCRTLQALLHCFNLHCSTGLACWIGAAPNMEQN